jgi:hypothetical protein
VPSDAGGPQPVPTGQQETAERPGAPSAGRAGRPPWSTALRGISQLGYSAGYERAPVDGQGRTHADRHGGPQPQQLSCDQRNPDHQQHGEHRRPRLVLVLVLVVHQPSP